jgi:hypothetical protein
MTEISRLSKVDLREVWQNEAHDFTPWMLENSDALGEALGMDLDLHEAEHTVGDFSLDLIGVDVATGELVIVENQLARSDHTHLGQILTYAGGTNPVNVVWVTETFRPEHRAALDWLNERTDEGTRFFGVEIAAVRIRDSAYAPLFTVVANPNNWRKEVRMATSGTMSPQSQAYQKFWEIVLEELKQKCPGWTKAKSPSNRQWMTLPSGTSLATYALVWVSQGTRVEIYLGNSDPDTNLANFNRLLAHKQELESAVGAQIEWEELPHRKACRVSINHHGDFQDASNWQDQARWLVDTAIRLRAAINGCGGMSKILSSDK